MSTADAARVMILLVIAMCVHIQRAMVLVLEAGPERQRAWGEHRAIMGAILDGHPEEAEERAFLDAANAGVFTESRLRGAR
jgi:DNA-binding GntR family transcriptional regulator